MYGNDLGEISNAGTIAVSQQDLIEGREPPSQFFGKPQFSSLVIDGLYLLVGKVVRTCQEVVDQLVQTFLEIRRLGVYLIQMGVLWYESPGVDESAQHTYFVIGVHGIVFLEDLGYHDSAGEDPVATHLYRVVGLLIQ